MAMSVELVDVKSSEDQGSCDVEVDHIPPLSEVCSVVHTLMFHLYIVDTLITTFLKVIHISPYTHISPSTMVDLHPHTPPLSELCSRTHIPPLPWYVQLFTSSYP